MEPTTSALEDLERTARDLAKRLIRRSVGFGDSLSDLKKSHMGASSAKESVSIGGWMAGKSYSTDFILVSQVDGQDVNLAFKLRDIYREVVGEIRSAAAMDDFHLEPG